ncbi:MAG: CRISPR-associated protein Cas5 [Planctomycetota bacterium]
MFCLYLQAPFGTFRTFTAGRFRPTAEFITYSAAYGLLLNVAGIEMRYIDEEEPMTVIKTGLPKFQLALGACSFPLQHTIYQQLHNYPVGTTGKEYAPKTKGSKYNIQPVRRAFLSKIKAYICFRGNNGFEQQVKEGLNGNSPRCYGLPFLGDNNFLIDRLEPVAQPDKAFWFAPIKPDSGEGLPNHVSRFTVKINRADMSQTESLLFAPSKEQSDKVPDDAWIEVGY